MKESTKDVLFPAIAITGIIVGVIAVIVVFALVIPWSAHLFDHYEKWLNDKYGPIGTPPPQAERNPERTPN